MNQPLTTEQLHNKLRPTGFNGEFYDESSYEQSKHVVMNWSDDEWFETFIDAIS